MSGDLKLPLDGECRCGQVRIRVSKPPLITMACHCTGCQRMSASAFSLSAAIPTDGFVVTQGEPVIGGLHGVHPHYFCPYCLSWMFTRIDGVDQFLNVRATTLDDVSWYVPFIETCTKEKLAWATTPALHSFERFPPVSDYEALIAQYTQQLARSLA